MHSTHTPSHSLNSLWCSGETKEMASTFHNPWEMRISIVRDEKFRHLLSVMATLAVILHYLMHISMFEHTIKYKVHHCSGRSNLSWSIQLITFLDCRGILSKSYAFLCLCRRSIYHFEIYSVFCWLLFQFWIYVLIKQNSQLAPRFLNYWQIRF